MVFISFQVYEHNRIKAFKFFPIDNILVTISTEGFVTVWQVDFAITYLKSVSGDIHMTDKVEPLYSFEIESRLISVDCKLERKKAKNVGEVGDPVAVRSTTHRSKQGFIRNLTQNKHLTRIGAQGGRRGAKGLAKLKKFNFLLRLNILKGLKKE